MATAYRKHWPRRNLGELVNFLEAQHGGKINLNELATKIGTTEQNVSGLLVRDDMKLSRVEEWVRKYGYELKLFFPESNPLFNSGTPAINLAKYPNAGNLAGLIKYISDKNITINHMRQRIGCSGNTLNKAFITGDIFMSMLYEMIGNLKIEVIWQFEKTKKQTI